MEIVIEIPEEYYNVIKSIPDIQCNADMLIIKYGTPLPKGHGALKDTDKIISDGISKGFCDWYDEIKYADTIIEVDRAESEE